MGLGRPQKLVLVTGASRGIGKAIVERLGAQANYFILGTATSQANADTITAYMKDAGISGCGHALNINHHDHLDSRPYRVDQLGIVVVLCARRQLLFLICLSVPFLPGLNPQILFSDPLDKLIVPLLGHSLVMGNQL